MENIKVGTQEFEWANNNFQISLLEKPYKELQLFLATDPFNSFFLLHDFQDIKARFEDYEARMAVFNSIEELLKQLESTICHFNKMHVSYSKA